MKKYLFILPLALLGACASSPNNIPATYVDGQGYEGLNCNQLSVMQINETDKLAVLTSKQRRAHKTDTWGVILLGVPLSELTGSDVSETLANEKGKVEAIKRVELEKSCSKQNNSN